MNFAARVCMPFVLLLLLLLTACGSEPASAAAAVARWNETAGFYNETALLANSTGWGDDPGIAARFEACSGALTACRYAIEEAGTQEALNRELSRLGEVQSELEELRAATAEPFPDPSAALRKTAAEASALYGELSSLIRENRWDRDAGVAEEAETLAGQINAAIRLLGRSSISREEAESAAQPLRAFLRRAGELRSRFQSPCPIGEGRLVTDLE